MLNIESELMKKYTIIIYCFLFLVACNQKAKNVLREKNFYPSGINILAHNLSEDLSVLASNNDEILFLLFSLEDSKALSLLSKYIIFDATNTKDNIPFDFEKLQSSDLLFIMLEIDTDKEISEVERLVEQNLKPLQAAIENQDRIAQKEILGDDDILGIKLITAEELSSLHKFRIQGFHKVDQFEYEFILKM